jgi:hypothetical protein
MGKRRLNSYDRHPKNSRQPPCTSRALRAHSLALSYGTRRKRVVKGSVRLVCDKGLVVESVDWNEYKTKAQSKRQSAQRSSPKFLQLHDRTDSCTGRLRLSILFFGVFVVPLRVLLSLRDNVRDSEKSATTVSRSSSSFHCRPLTQRARALQRPWCWTQSLHPRR